MRDRPLQRGVCHKSPISVTCVTDLTTEILAGFYSVTGETDASLGVREGSVFYSIERHFPTLRARARVRTGVIKQQILFRKLTQKG